MKVALVALLESIVPSFSHWYWRLLPVAVTESTTLPPLATEEAGTVG